MITRRVQRPHSFRPAPRSPTSQLRALQPAYRTLPAIQHHLPLRSLLHYPSPRKHPTPTRANTFTPTKAPTSSLSTRFSIDKLYAMGLLPLLPEATLMTYDIYNVRTCNSFGWKSGHQQRPDRLIQLKYRQSRSKKHVNRESLY